MSIWSHPGESDFVTGTLGWPRLGHLKQIQSQFGDCDTVYDSMTDAEGAQTVKMFRINRTKLGVLIFNTAHDNEMYQQIVPDMRFKSIVPPSSEAGDG